MSDDYLSPNIVAFDIPDDLPFISMPRYDPRVRQRRIIRGRGWCERCKQDFSRRRYPKCPTCMRRFLANLRTWTDTPGSVKQWRAYEDLSGHERRRLPPPLPHEHAAVRRLMPWIQQKIDRVLQLLTGGKGDEAEHLHQHVFMLMEQLRRRVEDDPPRSPAGRPEGSGGRFTDVEDFRQTVITDLRHLRENRIPDTQLSLARLWYHKDKDETAVVDSLVAEIKRYCKHYNLPWKELKAEARRS
jgi:hypothetical protein